MVFMYTDTIKLNVLFDQPVGDYEFYLLHEAYVPGFATVSRLQIFHKQGGK